MRMLHMGGEGFTLDGRRSAAAARVLAAERGRSWVWVGVERKVFIARTLMPHRVWLGLINRCSNWWALGSLAHIGPVSPAQTPSYWRLHSTKYQSPVFTSSSEMMISKQKKKTWEFHNSTKKTKTKFWDDYLKEEEKISEIASKAAAKAWSNIFSNQNREYYGIILYVYSVISQPSSSLTDGSTHCSESSRKDSLGQLMNWDIVC